MAKLLVPVLFSVLVFYMMYERPRLYHADLLTEIVQLEAVDSDRNRWIAEDLNICEPQAELALFEENTESNAGDSLCSSSDFRPASELQQEPILRLLPGTRAVLQWSLRSGLNIELHAKSGSSSAAELISAATGQKMELGPKIILHRPPQGDSLTAALTFPFEGYGVFGTDARLGVTGLLSQGQISAYEDTPLIGERYLVQNVELSLGDTVKFINDSNQNVPVKGFLRIALNDEGVEQGIYAIAYSNISGEAGASESGRIKVFRFGSEGYEFSPTLWARLQNAPDIILFVSFLGLIMALAEANSLILSFRSNKKNDE